MQWGNIFLQPSGRNIKFKSDLSHYETKSCLKGAADADTSNLAAKSDLGSVKTEVTEIDVG